MNFAQHLEENTLWTSQVEKDEFLKDKKKIANAFLFGFLGPLALINAAKNNIHAVLYFKSDKKIRIQNISDINNDSSLIIKILNDLKAFRNTNTINDITRFLAKMKSGSISDINSSIVKGWVENIRRDVILIPLDPRLKSILQEFLDDQSPSLHKMALKLKKVHKLFVDNDSEFATLIRKSGTLKEIAGIDDTPIDPNKIPLSQVPAHAATATHVATTTIQPIDYKAHTDPKTNTNTVTFAAAVANNTKPVAPPAPPSQPRIGHQPIQISPAPAPAPAPMTVAAPVIPPPPEPKKDTSFLPSRGDAMDMIRAGTISMTDYPFDIRNNVYAGAYSEKQTLVLRILRDLVSWRGIPTGDKEYIQTYKIANNLAGFLSTYEKELSQYYTDFIRSDQTNPETLMDRLFKLFTTYRHNLPPEVVKFWVKWIKDNKNAVFSAMNSYQNVKKMFGDELTKEIFGNEESYLAEKKKSITDIFQLINFLSDHFIYIGVSSKEMDIDEVTRKLDFPEIKQKTLKFLMTALNYNTTIEKLTSYTYIRHFYNSNVGLYLFSLLDDNDYDHLCKELAKIVPEKPNMPKYVATLLKIFNYDYFTTPKWEYIKKQFGKVQSALLMILLRAGHMFNAENRWKQEYITKEDLPEAIELIRKYSEEVAPVEFNVFNNMLIKSWQDQPKFDESVIKSILEAAKIKTQGDHSYDVKVHAIMHIIVQNTVTSDARTPEQRKYAFEALMAMTEHPEIASNINLGKTNRVEYLIKLINSGVVDNLSENDSLRILQAINKPGDNMIKQMFSKDAMKNISRREQKARAKSFVFNMFFDNLKTHPDLCDDLFEELDPYFQNIIRNGIVSADLLITILEKGPILPMDRLDSKRLKKLLSYNNIELESIFKGVMPRKKKNEKISQYIARADKTLSSIESNLGELKVSEKEQTRRQLDSATIDLCNKYYAGRHGRIYPKINKIFDVHLSEEQYNQFTEKLKGEGIDPNYVIPAFHGTGGHAACMILRYGFAVITGNDHSVAGRMLGDGIYITNTIDKSAQYVSNRGHSRGVGNKGYIFHGEAQAGRKGTHHQSAGLGRDHIRSPEWILYDAASQLKIIKAYEVELITEETYKKIKSSFGNLAEDTTEEKQIMKFRDYLVERENENMEDEEKFIFCDGMIPQKDRTIVEYTEAKLPKHTKIEMTAYGPAVVFKSNKWMVYEILWANSMEEDMHTRYFELLDRD